jgi:hypothetical protein
MEEKVEGSGVWEMEVDDRVGVGRGEELGRSRGERGTRGRGENRSAEETSEKARL